ncbi:MAG: hypothetical protein U9R02_14565 [Thermodesulfobacteriota bacterium]|nr:hypothetical protein [Thermodesulfobacteriota bacterium]
MNNKIVAIVGALVFVVVVAGSGCVGGGSTATDMIKMVPEGDGAIYFFYADVQTIRDDKDLHDIYKEFEKIPSGLEEELVDIDDVNYVAAAGKLGEEESNLSIFVGRFDLKDVRGKLEYDLDFDKDEYKGVELWLGEYDKAAAAVAIGKDKLIIGDEKQVKNCIKVTKGDRTSIYDNESVRDVLNKLPDGIETTLVTSGDSHRDGILLAMGSVLMKEDEDILKMEGVVKFDDEDDAIDARADFKRNINEAGVLFDVDVKQKEELLEFSARMGIEDWEEGYS